MDRFLPNFRLLQLARRLQEEHPDPPRQVSLLEVVGIYAPMLAYTGFILVVLIVLLLVSTRSHIGATIFVPFGLMAVSGTFIAGILVTVAKGALEKGVLTTGEVVSGSGMTARMRTTVRGRELEATWNVRGARSLRVGDRFNILVDPQKESVLMSLGRATT
jgi:hypothetical protein